MARPETKHRMEKAIARRRAAEAAFVVAQSEWIAARREYDDASNEWAREYMHEARPKQTVK